MVALVCLAVPARGLGDTVLLRNGMKIRGRVLTDADGTVIVKVQHGVVRLDPNEVDDIHREDEATNLLADARELARSGRYTAAFERIDRASLAGAASAEVRLTRLAVLMRQAARLEGALRLAEAHEVLRQAQSMAPEDRRIADALDRVARRLSELRGLVESARFAVESNDLAGACDLYERSVRAAPEMRMLIGREFADVCESLGDAALTLSDGTAAHWYDRALSLEPGRAGELKQRYIHARLLPVLESLDGGHVGAALQSLSSLVEFAPGDSQVRYVYGRILEVNGRPSDARQQYAAALHQYAEPGDHGDALFDLGSLRKRVQARLRDIRDEADSQRAERERRSRIDDVIATRSSGTHFVVHGRNAWLAERVLAVADHQVEDILSSLGDTVRLNWDGPCPIYLLPDAEQFQAATGQPAWSGGLSHTESLNGRLTRQYLTVYQTSARLLESTVPHEVSHLVFSAVIAYAAGVPLALHEGFAVSQEPGMAPSAIAAYWRGAVFREACCRWTT